MHFKMQMPFHLTTGAYFLDYFNMDVLLQFKHILDIFLLCLKCKKKKAKITFVCLKESEIQLGPGDCGDDSRFLLLGIHRDSDSRRLYLIQTGCKQVTATAGSLG